ncbi:GGDEF domain-containing protein [Idiomarina tyrosinivorans]|uniref:diguanylate cyclase n=1 Tax=Idiomarina tyrosinivorans TaxID=1445662 RepID=A0A432ZQA9_9GAMM|nr:GGDEF domain-containing protein [Idiomarina tyrosinivorans]RUO80028.1 GGDEF domain-containing protein [Idiomarina tyrosinivorans]
MWGALPVIAGILLALWRPEWLAQFPFSELSTVVGAIALVAVLTAVLRQWDWWFWLAWVGGNYAFIQQGLQQPLADPDIMARYQALAVWLSVSGVLLALLPRPPLPTVRGFLVVALIGLLPQSLLLASIAGTLAIIEPNQWLLLPSMADWYAHSGLVLWTVLISGLWATALLYRKVESYRWSQWAAWLASMVFLFFIAQPYASAWMTLSILVGFLLALTQRLLSLAYIDELTQLPQRRALLNHLQRLGRRSAVAMLDVDHFKKFNDRHGHDVGDQVLKLLGSLLSKEKRCKAYRYGGEEFTLVFSHNKAERIAETLEDVRQQVADYPLVLRDQQRPEDKRQGKAERGKGSASKTLRITISLGCALRQPGEATEALLKRADQALYKSKKAGRNRVTLIS